MSKTVALIEGLNWHDELMGVLHRGRGDKEKRVRGELSDLTGIPESYLFRMTHKRRDMRDIAGEAYRRLRLAYDRLCTGIETKADAVEREAQQIEERHAAFASHQAPVRGSPETSQGEERIVK